MNCIKCNAREGKYHFRVLQVQTLHVRDLNGHKRVQALGNFEEYEVCADCAREKYREAISDKALYRGLLPYALLFIGGLFLTPLFWNGEGVFRLLGLSMLLAALMGAFGVSRSLGEKKRKLVCLEEAEALSQCAWECLVEGAPKKDGINDLTYIPVDEATLARKNGDLMILYDLLPEIAIEAHKRIHEEA